MASSSSKEGLLLDATDYTDVGGTRSPLPGESRGDCVGRWKGLTYATKVGIVVAGLVVLFGAGVGLVVSELTSASGAPPRPTPARQGPVIINTWWGDVTNVSWAVVNSSFSALDAAEAGCSYAEAAQKDGTVGYGGSPDTNGETTLDALIMDGQVMDIGAVGYLRDIKSAISTARRVLTYTRHTMLAGDGARDFAVMTGFNATPLNTSGSDAEYETWLASNCVGNYYQPSVVNAATGVPANASCGPYRVLPTPAPTPYPAGASGWTTFDDARPLRHRPHGERPAGRPTTRRTRNDHDTVGLCALDVRGNIALGMSSNGASHKVAGRIGDAPIVGAGGYASNEGGCAAATGDGDITARFLPAFTAVESMRRGMSPEEACADAVARIAVYYPVFELGLVCMDRYGRTGAASHGWVFTYCEASPATGGAGVCHQKAG
jgi:N4-(beta-N-acetylglucosaminyl)-L-asparaginase